MTGERPPLELGARERNGRMGWILAGVWLIYLAYPVGAAWKLDTVPRVFGLTLIALFAVAYLSAFMLFRTRYAWPRPATRIVWSVVGTLLLIMVVAMFPLGSAAFAFSVYIAALGAFTLPTKQSWLLSLGLVASALILPLLISSWEKQESLAFQLIVATFAAWGIGQIILRNQQLAAAREQLAVWAVAEERLRVGRDVHDILGHSLTVITIKTELARRLIDVDVERAKAELEDIERLSRDALAGVRSTVGGLREVTLAGELANANSALSAAGIRPVLPHIADSDISKPRGEIFAWVLREAVTNVVRHSGAQQCEVRVRPTEIEIVDDGGGYDKDNDSSGSGLAGLRERVSTAGGTLRIGSNHGRGFRLVASFPDSTVAEEVSA
ncbi:sensor histidine kinase [Antrihabitans cavernicola]|uniref:Sensor histidine kinase n=1 Tax=Antrihabitans cavernicola TaxID=2495913 RepID=A0A5A7SE83_9NOCA|nr:sensor histidine kinase [Spelaeibacter cavernicola]KAA0023007.1 sensor histidine kinase [Spelaeibacter cavernicola]